ncbi:MAG: isocitrate dehydrogenase (NADP(+)) [candidate division WOR-3 bacterium]|nr:isocitrate dehydrogenase (NADP(+)) [candidate division WOR-3 bacterium]
MKKENKQGEKITIVNGELTVPNKPIIPFVEGDGIGADITAAMKRIVDTAVEKAYNGEKKIEWLEIYAGGKAKEKYDEYLPEETLDAMREYKVSIKGPLTTPVGGGYRSLNVASRQLLNLYACVRPVYWIKGVPSPMKHPEKMNMVIFRENTEDVYAGIEWKKGSGECKKVIKFLKEEFGIEIREDSGIGLKPMSEFASKRLIRKAIQYAIDNKRKSVTFVQKGNIMKFTEGAFREWGYEVAKEEFRDKILTEEELKKSGVKIPEDKILINDRLADNMLQQMLVYTDQYDVIATPNLNGDYLADAAAGQVGGLGVASSGNFGDEVAQFEATHGTAPQFAGLNVANPTALTLTAKSMLEYIGWKEAANLIYGGISKTINEKIVTFDLAYQMEGAKKVSTSEFADYIIKNIK